MTFIVLVLFSADAFAEVQIDVGTEAGKYAPPFELNDINEKKVSLSELKGRAVVICFWATWCGACKDEMVSLNELYSSLKEKGLMVIGISLDMSESRVKSFISEKGISFPVIIDKDKRLSRKYSVVGLPVDFLIDRKGIIVEKFRGATGWSSPEMKNKLLRLLDVEL